MAIFLLECREDEERQVNSPRKEVRNDGQFYQWCHFKRNLMVRNNIIIIFKPGARRAPGFLKLILCGLSVCVLACVCVCVSAPEAINN